MESEILDLQQVASLLQRDAREISKLATRGHLPGQKIGGEWRFASIEIQHWVEKELANYSAEELSSFESGVGNGRLDRELLITPLLSEACMAVPLTAGTRASVLKELITLAEQSWQLYDPEAALEAIRKREEIGSTAVEGGVAFLHPRRVLPATVLGESVLAFGRSGRGIPFGAPDGRLTDIFFVVLCSDQRAHLLVLARLARLLLLPDFLAKLRGAETTHETRLLIEDAEQSLIA